MAAPRSSGFERAVQVTKELARIARLPRRTWTEEGTQPFALELSEALKRPGGKMTLRAIQAQALFEAGIFGGLIAPIGVGQGKTLISVLVPYVRKLRRPLLVTRANLIDKTKREMRELAHHWPVPNFIRIVSYEILGRANHKDLLSNYKPDGIFFDECHRLKNPKAAVTRRVARYKGEDPTVEMYFASGTFTHRSLKDCWHLIIWSLGPQNAPVPFSYSEVEDWSEVIDEKPNREDRKVLPGALLGLCGTEDKKEKNPYIAARKAFKKRFVETPGVVASAEDKLGCSLTIEAIECSLSPRVDDAFQMLRDSWRTPDDWPISNPMAVWRHARELALGFYYRWDPRPPPEWIEPRKEWAALCRYILKSNRRNLDSELQVVNAVDAGHYPDAKPILDRWRQVKHLFNPNTVPVWLDDSVIDLAAKWAFEAPGIVWCEHVAFAERLAQKTNLVYYGQGGLDRQGRPIEAHDPTTSLIASEGSSAEGRNLQNWSRNLIVSVSSSGYELEQQIGRTHRPGQKADEVSVQIVLTCLEHATSFEQARKDAQYQEQVTGKPQRLSYADIVFPCVDEIVMRGGPRWTKAK